MIGAAATYYFQQRRSPHGRRKFHKQAASHEKLSALKPPWPYPKDHYALTSLPSSSDRFIAVLRVFDVTQSGSASDFRDVLVLLRSGEGYATVAVLVDRECPSRALNRIPTQFDYEAVCLAATQVAAAFLRLGIFPALELLGNNSHGVDPTTNGLVLGNMDEPFSPHVHIIGRGDPSHSYIGEVPLRGLAPGKVMVPRQRTEAFASNVEIQTVAHGIANSLERTELHPQVKIVEKRATTQQACK